MSYTLDDALVLYRRLQKTGPSPDVVRYALRALEAHGDYGRSFAEAASDVFREGLRLTSSRSGILPAPLLARPAVRKCRTTARSSASRHQGHVPQRLPLHRLRDAHDRSAIERQAPASVQDVASPVRGDVPRTERRLRHMWSTTRSWSVRSRPRSFLLPWHAFLRRMRARVAVSTVQSDARYGPRRPHGSCERSEILGAA